MAPYQLLRLLRGLEEALPLLVGMNCLYVAARRAVAFGRDEHLVRLHAGQKDDVREKNPVLAEKRALVLIWNVGIRLRRRLPPFRVNKRMFLIARCRRSGEEDNDGRKE